MAVSFDRTDLEYILKQIEMAENGQPPVDPHLAFGLREVSGNSNNLVPGQSTYGSVDQPFPTATTQYFRMVTVNIDGTVFDPHPGVAGDTMTTNYASSDPNGYVVDTQPRVISNLISDISADNPAAVAAAQQFGAQLGDGYTINPTNPLGLVLVGADGVSGTADDYWGSDGIQGTADDVDTANLFIGNITPDAGLSAPFNSWMTFFGQFFDHGLDMIDKGGNGTIYIPLLPDDPLYVPGSPTNFMVLTRATVASVMPGPDGVVGTADDIHVNINQTTPFVDQNQTYSSDPSHQVFLREYMIGVDGQMHSTGRLLTHAVGSDGIAGTADDHTGMATWGDLKASALSFGIQLTDYDVTNVPLLATDDYGNFQPGAHGHVQVVVDTGGGHFVLVEVDPAHPLTLDQIGASVGGTVARTGHAFINDMAATASPYLTDGVTKVVADSDTVAGNNIPMDQRGNFLAYDNELLDAHYIAGDGRVNENFGLTAVHEIFHDEHNRLLEQTKELIRGELAKGDTAFASQWVLAGADLSDDIQDNEWNGERLFQVAKFGTETQYQHLVFEEFARKIAPTIHLFGNVDIHLDPAIVSEFANAVYRFGHSMLDENLPVYQLNDDGTIAHDGSGNPILSDYGLIQAFTNPLAFASLGPDATAQIVQGTTQQVGSEIDEFVTGALRNNLLGLPLDLAALNISRARETGVAPLNLVRAQIYDVTHDQTLKAYGSWDEFGGALKHPASLINFIAAYGTHASIMAATTLEAKRDAAAALVTMGEDPASAHGDAQHVDAYNFMHSLGAYANDLTSALAVHAQWSTGSVTGVDNIDLWIGGLAEKQTLNGGLLGSTFNFIFETQMESLQDGDRLYYLPRIEGIHWGSEIEGNSFAEMIQVNTGAKHLPGSIFSTPEYTVEARDYFVKDANSADGFAHDAQGHRIATDSSTWLHNPVSGNLLVEVTNDGTVHFIGDDNFFGNTIVLGGTEADDRLQAGAADGDTVWGDGGNDWIDGGDGDDFLYGGDGHDTINGGLGLDTIHGDAGDDTIFAGQGDDTVFGGDGNDYIDGGAGIDDILGGLGNDIIHGGEDDDEISGNEGDDWLDGGSGGDLLVGDQGAPTGDVPWIAGNDVLVGGPQGDRMQGFSGDDIMMGQGGFDKFEGRLGYDWADFEMETQGVSVDMNRRELVDSVPALGGDAVRDFFIETEGVSGSKFDDVLMGTDVDKLDLLFNELNNVDLIFGLSQFFPDGPVHYSGGNIMLGGDGSDILIGRSGNDILDGDAYLHVYLDGDGGAGSNIVREILYDITPGDVDTAVYSGPMSNYIINMVPDAQGFITVSQIAANTAPGGGLGGGNTVTQDDTDKLRNIERIQFSDGTVLVDISADANQLPTGTIRIAGDTVIATPIIDPTVGSPLVAVNTISDPDGVVAGSMKLQWEVTDFATGKWIPIAGATSATFTPTMFYNGENLRVRVTYVDGKGYTESVVSDQTNAIIPSPTINTRPFIVPQQGLVGLPDTGARTGNPIHLFLPLVDAFGDNETLPVNLQYKVALANGQVLDGSAAALGLTFTQYFDPTTGLLAGGYINGTINTVGLVTIRVTATDNGPGTPLSVTDDFNINVIQGNRAPVASTALESVNGFEDASVSGVLLPGSDPDGTAVAFRLVPNSAVNGTVTNFNPTTGAFTFQGVQDFAGTATFQYTVFDGQLNSAPKTVSVNIAPVNDGAGTMSITGTPAVGGTITAFIGFDPDGGFDPATALYQWYRDGVKFGAPSISPDRVITAADVGHVFSATATYTDAQGFHESVSAAAIDPIGTLSVSVVEGVTTATLRGISTIFDPDGNPGPELTFYSWEVSVNGVNWTPVDASQLNADGSFTLANNTTRLVRVTEQWIDGAFNLNTATSEAMRVLVGGAGSQILAGTAANEIFFGLAGNDVVTTGGGNDVLVGGGGNDTLNGGAGNDTFIYRIGDGADSVDGGAGTDVLRITGTTAADSLAVTLAGGRLTQVAGGSVANVESVVLDLVGGNDTLTYVASTAANAVSVNLALGAASGFTSIANVLNVTGGAANDTLIGNDFANILAGGAGNDTLTGGFGDDTLSGGAGNDRFIASAGGDGNDSYDGGAGTDTLDLSQTQADALINLLTGTASSADIGNDTFANIESIIGGAGNDNFAVRLGANTVTIDGGAGIDTLTFTGTAANETLKVTLVGGALTAITGVTATHFEKYALDMGGGNDTLDYSGSSTANGATANLATGEASGFTSIAHVRNLIGGASADHLTGDDAANTLTGNDGADVLTGGAGNDTLNGGAGDDRFIATINDGNDTYNGAAGIDTLDLSQTSANATINLVTGTAASTQIGSDTLLNIENVIGGSGNDRFISTKAPHVFTGGAGADTFVYGSVSAAGIGSTRNVITDFTHLTDKIDFSGIDADTRGAAGGVQHFVFDGQKAAGSEAVGHIGYHYEGTGANEVTVIEGNVRVGASTSELTQDFQVALQGHLTITAGDLILG